MYQHRQSLIRRLLLLAALLLAPLSVLQAAFDPVNDDTDIFLANPNLASDRPNILILLDNTANWARNVGGQAIFVNEKQALIDVIAGLTDQFNVGLMMYPETGNPNDSTDGGYMRYAVRQMSTTNKSVLSTAVGAFDQNNDKGNNNTIALKMLEAYRYYAGKASRASWGKVKTDYEGSAVNPAAINGLGDYALGANPTAASLYNSPIVNSCQKNFIIVISNGGSNENAAALTISENELGTLTGTSPPNIIAISPDGQQGNWADEWARYMAQNDVNDTIAGEQNVYTYAVEVDPVLTGQGPAMTELMKSVAANGDGKYFAVTSQGGGQSIVTALNQIFQEIQAVNSVFAATTLPVSVNVRGTNLNQVYIGVFRPDATKSPRWYGNLKCYKLDYQNEELIMVDANGAPAQNEFSGFVNPTSPSFWTTSSSFWGFRTAEENGPGGASDLPDGDLVEKGGVAQMLRLDYASSQSARKLYTCTDYNTTTGNTSDPCDDDDPLSDYLFTTANTDLNALSLGLGIKEISYLTAEEVQPIDTLSDLRPVQSLTTAGAGVAVTELLTALTTSSSVLSISATQTFDLDALDNSWTSQAVSLDYVGTNKKHGIATSATNLGLVNGQTVTISGATDGDFNSSFIIFNVTNYVDGSSSFEFNSPRNLAHNDSGTVTTSSASVTATTSVNHGFTDGQSVTIAGVTPTSFNATWTNITSASGNSFRFNTVSGLGQVTGLGTVRGGTTTATVTLPAGHGLGGNTEITISGATPADYNGTKTVAANALTWTGTNTFTYTVPAGLADATGTITAAAGTPWARALAAGHGLSIGDDVTIAGATPTEYNGTFQVLHVSGNYFWYNAGSALADASGSMTAASGTSTTATATIASHGFGSAGDTVSIVVAGATPADYNGTHASATVVDADTIQYGVLNPLTAATGTITARLSTPTAHGYMPGHGLGVAGDTLSVEIRGADPTGFNGTKTLTIVDGDNFTYSLGSSLDATATGTPSVVQDSTTATARAVNHGFADGASVTVSGASPTAFNGTKTITVLDGDTFTYSVSPAQGIASGTITVELSGGGGGSVAEVTNLVNWVRGEDNAEDENENASSTDVRASVHGDVLHARPAVVNYNRHGDDNDVYVFYGANDGIFHAVKGGFNSVSGDPLPGHEAWGFIPEEFFTKLQRLRNDEPLISSSNKKPYFADGSIGTYVYDANNDGALNATDGDKVYLYLSMRRGGRFIYALDVSDPEAPKFLWKKTSAGETGNPVREMGQTWSIPKVVTDLRYPTPGTPTPLIFFGAGYDPSVEDLPPDQITASTAASVTTGSGTATRGMGRGIFALNALTGDVVWQAGPAGAAATGISHDFLTVSGMDYAIPSDVTVIHSRDSALYSDRLYVGDTGGNMWRVDIGDPDPANWTVSQLATVAGSAPGGLRKFFYPPDVVYDQDGFDAVLIGSGDREHPFDTSVTNRMYMFKDTATGNSAFDAGGNRIQSVITESDLYDATANCIQECSGGAATTATVDLANSDGWYITLGSGEKVISNAVTLNKVTFFNTNQPGAAVSASGLCVSDLGIARQYQVYYSDATSVRGDDAESRSEDHPGGGYLPSPVPVVVEIDGEIHEAVISGVRVDSPPGTSLNRRLRRFWYKEMP